MRGAVLIETVRRHKNGSLIHVDVSMRRVDVPGGETFIAVSKKDVTPLARVALAASEGKFRSLLEAAPDAIVIVNHDGASSSSTRRPRRSSVTRATSSSDNRSRCSSPHAIRRSATDASARLLRRAAGRAMGSGFELHGLRKDGTEFPVEISLSPHRHRKTRRWSSSAIRDYHRPQTTRTEDAGGEPPEERVPREHVARAPHAAQRDHRLRRADAQGQGRAGRRRNITSIWATFSTSSKHLLQLINDVLDLAKVESGKMDFRPEPVDLVEVGRGSARHLARARGREAPARRSPRRCGAWRRSWSTRLV